MLGAVDLIQPANTPALFESGQFDLQRTDPPKVVVSAVGPFSCCDVWFSQPDRSGHRFWINVYGRVGDLRVLLVSVKATELTLSTDGSREGALAAAVRGRPCTAFEIECATEEGIAGVNVFVQAWHADVAMDVTGIDRTVVARQGSPAAQSDRWPVYLSTGTAERGLVNTPLFTRLSDGTAALGSVANPIITTAATSRATYSVASDRALALGAAAGTTTILGALWMGASPTKRIEVQRIEISFWGASTSGAARVRLQRIISQPSSGTSLTAQNHDTSDAAASATFKVLSTALAMTTDILMFVVKPDAKDVWVWTAAEAGKPMVLLNNQGLEIRAVTDTAMASAMTFGINMQWIEI